MLLNNEMVSAMRNILLKILCYLYMSLPDDEIYKIKVGDVYFTVKKSVNMTYMSAPPTHDFVKIGGDDMCVEYKYSRKNPTVVELQWLHTDGRKCAEGDMVIKGDNTLMLFYLSVQVLKLYTPVTHIELLDNSQFNCKLPDGTDGQIYLKDYYYIFYGKTWYEYKLGAYPLNPKIHKQYYSFSKNFDDPTKKPSDFSFNNDDLTKIFQPIWDSSNTWRTFIQKIKTLPDICQKIYPWYGRASWLLRNKTEMPEWWVIDVGQLKFKPIPFERVEKMKGGRIRMKKYIRNYRNGSDYPSPTASHNLKYV